MSELMEKEQPVQMEPLEADTGTPVKKKLSRKTRRRIIH